MFFLCFFKVWRGSNWRGKDCSDLNPKIYPGRLPHYADVNYDGNCNGIWGLDQQTGIPWETKLCGSSKSRGIVMFGDSVGAHFHFPLVWFNPKLISKVSNRNIKETTTFFLLLICKCKIVKKKLQLFFFLNHAGYIFKKFYWCPT